MRILLTGSRRWPDAQTVHDTLTTLVRDKGPFTLVHGACATGADAQAHQWFLLAGRALGCAEDPHPADWEKFGKAAGPARNVRMVAMGADLVVAFPLPEGTGTQHTVELAEKAGIPVRKVRLRRV